MTVNELRKQIDILDSKIVDYLNKRSEITVKIRNLKKKAGKGVYSPEREQEVIRRIKNTNKGPLPNCSLEAIYREIMSGALALERPLKIAYLGPEATFTHLAAIKKFGSQLEYLPCDSIASVFREVEKTNADYGVVPIENSIEGAVTHTLDMLIDSDLSICSEVMMSVTHNLLSNHPREKITKIYSNPQVFAQCRKWLRENFSNVEMIETSSTAKAAQIAGREKSSACIANILAAKVYNLKVLAKNIEDSSSNVTRFLVISSNKAAAPTGNDKTSLVFSIKDKVGALYEILASFKKYNINLTKIESRPSKKKAWDYYFFLDLEGYIENKNVSCALKELENSAKYLKILGSYPKGE